MTRYEVAVELVAEYGLPVFPCLPTKAPATANGFKDASVDLERIDEWFAAGDRLVGVPTGIRFWTLDIDPDGEGWYRENQHRLGCGLINKTRRGWHLHYALPPGIDIKCSASKVAPGVDVRGSGGYVLWWPAEGLPTTATLADLTPAPDWLLALVQAPGQERTRATEKAASSSRGKTFGEGQRNDGLTRLAGKLRRDGLSPGELLAALHAVNQERCQPPLPAQEVEQIARSIGGKPAKAAEADTQDDEAPPPPPPMDWHGLAGKVPPRRQWVEEHWLPYDPALLAGKGGAGKTLVAEQMATSWASGRGFLEAVSRPMTVLMWACEDDHDELWRRQAAICQWLGIDIAALAGRLWIVPRRGHENTLFAPVYGRPQWTPQYRQLREQANDLKADVLILDNTAQTFAGDENSRHDVTAFVNGMAGLRLDAPFAPLLLAHPPKAEGSEYSGSTAWENAVRTRWFLGPTLPDVKLADDLDPDPSIRYLARRKANYSAQDWRRLRYTDGVLVPEATADGSRYDNKARQAIAEAVLLKGLREVLRLNLEAVPGSTSRDYLPSRLAELKLAEGHSKRELAEALARCICDGRVVIEQVRSSGRHPRKVLRPSLG